MLHWRHRLRDRKSIQLAHRRGQLQRSRFLTLKTLSGPADQPPRVAVIISTKVAKKATVRNRLRRRIRGAVAPWQEQLQPGAQILIIVTHSGLTELSPKELAAEVLSCLRAARALH